MNIQEKSDKLIVTPGKPITLGATVHKKGVNFCTQVDVSGNLVLLVYKKGTTEVLKTLPFDETMRYGRVYAMNVVGFDIRRFDYGYELDGKFFKDAYGKIVNGHDIWGMKKDITYTVYNDNFNWNEDRKPNYDFSDMVMYRIHTRGFTMHKSSRVKNKGTFKGIAEKSNYLKELGITSIELMPSYDFDEIFVDVPSVDDIKNGINSMRTTRSQDGKVNYFGYVNGHYFAPKGAFSAKSGQACVNEFKEMVKTLHSNGIEVIMEFYFTAGTNPHMITDCLRHWVMEYHIDGIRINLDVAPVNMLKSDPILADIKIIGDRWNIISEYEEGNPGYEEKRHIGVCHDGFMITARKYIKSDENQVHDMISKIKENNDNAGIINYIANHNSFTVMDMVSYERKHNEANGENNMDGSEYNYSWNCGLEGPTRKRKIMDTRKQQIKNAFALLFISQGTPMIFQGDEMGRTQGGNNNPYCQDNELTWVNWNNLKTNSDIYSFIKMMIDFRKEHKILHASKELKFMDYKSLGYPDLSFHGNQPWRIDYHHVNRSFALLYNENYIPGCKGMIYVASNMYWESEEFNIPVSDKDTIWKVVIATDKAISISEEKMIVNNRTIVVPPRSIVILTEEKTKQVLVKRKMAKTRKIEKE